MRLEQITEEDYLKNCQRLFALAQNNFQGCESKNTLVDLLKQTINAKDYYSEQSAISLLRFAEASAGAQTLKLQAEEAKTMVKMLEAIQKKISHKIIGFA